MTPDVIAVTRRPGCKSSSNIDKKPLKDDITERFLDVMGLLALERVEKMETEQQYHDLLQNANNSEQVQILTELVEQRGNENKVLSDKNRRSVEQLQLMRMVDTTGPFTNSNHQKPTLTKFRLSLGGTTLRSPLAPKAPAQRSSPDPKKLGELVQQEATLIQGNFRSEDRISVVYFDDHVKMSNVIQKIKYVVEQLGKLMLTNLINSVFLTAHGIIKMAMVLEVTCWARISSFFRHVYERHHSYD